MDETLITIDGREYWLWIAYEPSLHRCLMMRLSVERTMMICYMFLGDMRRRYGGTSRSLVILYTPGCLFGRARAKSPKIASNSGVRAPNCMLKSHSRT